MTGDFIWYVMFANMVGENRFIRVAASVVVTARFNATLLGRFLLYRLYFCVVNVYIPEDSLLQKIQERNPEFETKRFEASVPVLESNAHWSWADYSQVESVAFLCGWLESFVIALSKI